MKFVFAFVTKGIPIQKNDIKPALSGVQGLKMIIGPISYIWYSVR